MKIVSIPVSKPSACYLISLYGEPPLSIPWSSSLRSHLRTGPIKSDIDLSSHHDFSIGVLDVMIEVNVSDKLAKSLERSKVHVGWHLHNTMMDLMCEWVRAYVMAGEGNTIASGIRSFFEVHHIEVDVFDPDSAYKRYQRYMDNLDVIIERGFLPQHYGFTPSVIPLSLSECEKVSKLLYNRTRVYFKYSPNYNSIMSFVAGAFAKTNQRVVARRLKVWHTAVGHSYRRLSRRYVREPAFADLVIDTISDVREKRCVLEPVLSTSAYS